MSTNQRTFNCSIYWDFLWTNAPKNLLESSAVGFPRTDKPGNLLGCCFFGSYKETKLRTFVQWVSIKEGFKIICILNLLDSFVSHKNTTRRILQDIFFPFNANPQVYYGYSVPTERVHHFGHDPIAVHCGNL